MAITPEKAWHSDFNFIELRRRQSTHHHHHHQNNIRACHTQHTIPSSITYAAMTMLPRLRLRPTGTITSLTQNAIPKPSSSRRTLIAAPKPNSGPLMTRRADRSLPSLSTRPSARTWLTTLPLFLAICTGSALAIFNYQKTSSSVVSSTMYALRCNKLGRELLGDEVQFGSQVPWIHGELNQLQGRVDLWWWVKGDKGSGKMRFRSERVGGRMGGFVTREWSLEVGGRVWDLMGEEGN